MQDANTVLRVIRELGEKGRPLDRIYRQQLVGVTSSHVMSDVAHRLMKPVHRGLRSADQWFNSFDRLAQLRLR